MIIRTSYPGQAPQIVENQVTYPLTTTMLSVPARASCAAIRSSATALSMCCSTKAPISTGRGRACSNICHQVQGRLPAGARASRRPRCNGRWLDLRICAGRPQRPSRSRRTAVAAGLVPAHRAQKRPRCRRSREHRRDGAPVPDRARSAKMVAYGVTQAQIGDAVRAGNSEAGGAVVELAGPNTSSAPVAISRRSTISAAYPSRSRAACQSR